jgi:hypothetical protein
MSLGFRPDLNDPGFSRFQSGNIENLINNCWQTDPNHRPSALDIKDYLAAIEIEHKEK